MREHIIKIIAACLVPAAYLLSAGCGDSDENSSITDKAAIIDQLCLLEPNPSFIAEATRILEDYGFTVDFGRDSSGTVKEAVLDRGGVLSTISRVR